MQIYKFEENKAEFIADNKDSLKAYLYSNYINLQYSCHNRYYNLSTKRIDMMISDITTDSDIFFICFRHMNSKQTYILLYVDFPRNEFIDWKIQHMNKYLALVRNSKLENLLKHLDI